MTYRFEKLPQVKNLRGKLPHKGWYKVYPESVKTDIAVHHSLTKTGSSKAFANYHVGTNNWPEVAYHFVILKDGTIEYNHQLGVLSYHVGNSNKHAVGVCLVGDFRSEEPTEAQKESFRELHECLVKDMPNYKRTKGHDEFPGYSWKACPEFDYKAVLVGSTPKTGATYSGKTAVLPGDSGSEVKALQNDLLALGYDLGGYGADGSYGPATEKAVKAFQKVEGLTVDGYYGPNTQKAMAQALLDHAAKAKAAANKPADKPKQPKGEDEEMLKEAIVIGSYSDYPAAEVLAVRKNAPIYPRKIAEGEEVAKHLYVVGGGKDGLKAEKITDLSGKDRFETMQNVKEAK